MPLIREIEFLELTAGDVLSAHSFVMDRDHKRELLRHFGEEAKGRRIFVLDDDYEFMDSELISFITAGVQSALGD